MKAAVKSSLWAFGITVAFFGLVAAFMKMGPCGPASDTSAVLFVIMLPAIWSIGILKIENSIVAWSVISIWIYALSWIFATVTLWGIRRVKNR